MYELRYRRHSVKLLFKPFSDQYCPLSSSCFPRKDTAEHCVWRKLLAEVIWRWTDPQNTSPRDRHELDNCWKTGSQPAALQPQLMSIASVPPALDTAGTQAQEKVHVVGPA